VSDRVTVYEAAKRLGVSEGAVRQRIHRGKLQTDKDETGRVYVYLTSDDTSHHTVKTPHASDSDSILLDELRDRIRFLEQELDDRKEESRRKDSIIMSLTQRVPELEAAAEPRESVVSASEPASNGAVPMDSAEAEISKSWWQKLFGG
jgi:hypothetical protein